MVTYRFKGSFRTAKPASKPVSLFFLHTERKLLNFEAGAENCVFFCQKIDILSAQI